MIENKNWNKDEATSIQAADEAREKWLSKSYIGSIFMGDFDVSMAYPFPEQEARDKAIGDDICAKVDAWCAENVDGDEIDRTETIPAHVLKGLADLGLFGIKIPKEYGGLGLSQTNYMRILSTLALHCGSVTATLSAHQSIGVPQPLKLVGTKQQKEKWLPMIAKGAITAFALTEPEVGSDPAKLSTTATRTEEGDWLINGDKLWCTNSVIADLLVVMCISGHVEKRGRKVPQISAFIVETSSPGFEILHRCRFMGIRAIENGLIRFNNVRVPNENIIGGEGNGLKVAFATLNDGRLGIPAITAQSTLKLEKFCSEWAKSRKVFGKYVGEHEAGSDKLARISSGGYAMNALSDYCAALSDGGLQDLRMEAATAKMFNTELSWDLIDTAVQLRGGRGYETATSLEERGEVGVPMERALRDARINRIVEGTTDVMQLFLTREAIDPHMQNAKPLFMKSSFGLKLKTFVKCAFIYSFWMTKMYMPSFYKPFFKFDPKLRPWLRAIDRRTKKVARRFFLGMVRHGPNLANKQLTLSRVINIGAELSVMGLVVARIQTEMDKGSRKNLNRALYWLESSTNRCDQMFTEMSRNSDKKAVVLAKELMTEVDPIPTPDISGLVGQAYREIGSEITSGKLKVRRREETKTSKDGSAAAK